MTQDKARKAAVRVRMAETGESYAEAARQLANPVSAQAVLDLASRKFGIPPDVLPLFCGHIRETSEYPFLPTDARDRLKVYLDLKDWVALAKARLGRPEFPQDGLAYQALRTATAAGQVIVPLSATTYQELSRITSLRQRTDLANVIAEISGFVTITGRSVATKHQVLTALAARFGGPEPAPVRPLGIGIQFATGDQRRLVLRGRDDTPPNMPQALVREIETAAALLEYMMARGPEPGDLPALRAYGYRPEAVEQVEQDRLKREKQLAAMLRDGTAGRGRLGDLVHARYLFWELDNQLRVGLDQYGIDVSDFFANDKEWLTAFLDDIPGAAITDDADREGVPRTPTRNGRATTYAMPMPCPPPSRTATSY